MLVCRIVQVGFVCGMIQPDEKKNKKIVWGISIISTKFLIRIADILIGILDCIFWFFR
jgi:hypothetical protein